MTKRRLPKLPPIRTRREATARPRSRSDAEWLADGALLEQFLEAPRLARLDAVLAYRTRAIAVVVEDAENPRNIGAIGRTCDAFGIQDVHAVLEREGTARFYPGRKVSTGTERWLTFYSWNGMNACVDHLRSRGYRIAAATLDGPATLEDVDYSQPTALMFGNERFGLSKRGLEAADVCFRIPMVGFSSSLNISVAAGLCIYQARQALTRQRRTQAGDLTSDEKALIRARWIVEALPRADDIVDGLRRRERRQME